MPSTHAEFEELTHGLATKSEKIRVLARNGVPTAEIARFLGIRYQHARNVLVDSGLRGNQRTPASQRDAEIQTVPADTDHVWLTVSDDGELKIPLALLKRAGLEPGARAHVRLGEEGLEVLSEAAALRRASRIARAYVPEGMSLVDDLIAERRREAGLKQEQSK